MSAAPLASLLLAAVVQVGLERLEAEGGRPLLGKRVGLLANAASVTADGRQALAVLRGLGIDVRRLFAPEHGLAGRAPAGETVAGGVDPALGLPVVSLYGDRPRPEPSDLVGLDALVFDLQDAGVRFYTYNSLLLLCLEAAAQAGIELVVLDRPNPLGGERVEGPVADPALAKSFVNRTPGPLVHGMTSGELARYANARAPRPGRLTVLPLRGWTRAMTWSDTERPWVPPSPNLRSPEAALAYPGTCLLEATNVSEGRGTGAPFLLLGAPWLKPEELRRAATAPGFALEAARFVPRATEAAPAPKYRDQECLGLRVRVTDAKQAEPYALGLSLLAALKRLHPQFRWPAGGAAFDTLLGTRAVREALERGEGARAILGRDALAIEAFRRERSDALLY